MNSSNTQPQTAVVIVAAGSGTRLSSDIPKQYHLLAGKPVLEHSLQLFSSFDEIKDIVIAYNANHIKYLQPLLAFYPKVIAIEGGRTRQESVFLALQALDKGRISNVLIHDAARPYVSKNIVQALLQELQYEKAAIPVLPVSDTIKMADKKRSYIRLTPDREKLYIAQTPQAFDLETILYLHRKYRNRAATDDATLAEWKKIPVKLIAGDKRKIKIDYAEELKMLQRELTAPIYRTGFGIDIHKIIPHNDHVPDKRRVLRLCGVDIHSDVKLEGHSDADVGLHALTDAILGALAEGDIGVHFPPSDPKWRGADSSLFLLHAKNLLHKHNAELVNVDISITAQTPRINPYREEMKARVAEILDLDISQVSIKATTSEGLGFTGRGEGITAQAVVTIMLAKNVS